MEQARMSQGDKEENPSGDQTWDVGDLRTSWGKGFVGT